MENYILYGYEFMVVLLPAAVLTGLLYRRYHRRKMEWCRFRALYLLVFAVYLFGVFHFTGAGTVYDAVRLGVEWNSINLVPFSDPNWDVMGYGLNVVLFLPLGFLMPLVWPRLCELWHAVVFGVLLSGLVECSQLLNFRATDVDDLILNTLGAAAGYLGFRLFAVIFKRGDTEADGGGREAVLYVLGVFLVRFFVYNEFGAAQLLFGF